MAKESTTSTPPPRPSPAPDLEATQTRMTFGEHLEELRRRVMNSLYGAIFGVAFCVYYLYDIFDLIARPYRIAAKIHHVPDVFNTFKPQEGFMTLLTLALQSGLVLTSPWIIFQIWKFIGAGLYPRERKIVYRYVGPSALLFLLGVAFFYFIVLPATLNFFFTFTAHSASPPPVPTQLEKWMMGIKDPPPTTGPATTATSAPASSPMFLPARDTDPPDPPPGQAVMYYDTRDDQVKIRVGNHIDVLLVSEEGSMFINMWRASDYLGFVAFTALIFGLAFEMPMVILILAQVGIVETQTFRNMRKYAYFGILIAAVFAAPSGDFMTLLFLFVPLLFLYELGIVLAAIVVGRQERAAKAEG